MESGAVIINSASMSQGRLKNCQPRRSKDVRCSAGSADLAVATLGNPEISASIQTHRIGTRQPQTRLRQEPWLRCDIETIRTLRRLTPPAHDDVRLRPAPCAAEEMVMSTTLTALVAQEARAVRSRAGGVTAILWCWWVAYINWRIEHAAVQHHAMSDRVEQQGDDRPRHG
jgi:hypothetical protein